MGERVFYSCAAWRNGRLTVLPLTVSQRFAILFEELQSEEIQTRYKVCYRNSGLDTIDSWFHPT
jgi:hypothetical protein